MAAMENAREVLGALAQAEEELRRMIETDAKTDGLRSKIDELVRRGAALRNEHEEGARGLDAPAPQVAQREEAINRIEGELKRIPPIFTEDQKTELLGLLGRK